MSAGVHPAPAAPAAPWVEAASRWTGRLYDGLMLLACGLLLMIVGVICADVLLRNVAIPGLPRGMALANDLSENALYLTTLLAAPWLLRHGLHIRVDIVLRALPRRAAWWCEWVSDVLALAGCVALTWVGFAMTAKSHAAGSIQIKTVVIPEWWTLAPVPVAFALLSLEMLLRMERLSRSNRGPRSDAVSSA